MTRYTSSDGLMSSSDPEAVGLWEKIGADMASEQARWSALLRSLGVKLEHPDDGWVHPTLPREERRDGSLHLSWYPRFNDSPAEGDLIALGSPSWGYRLVRCTRVEHGGVLIPSTTYHFVDTGRRLPEPAPTTILRRLLRRP